RPSSKAWSLACDSLGGRVGLLLAALGGRCLGAPLGGCAFVLFLLGLLFLLQRELLDADLRHPDRRHSFGPAFVFLKALQALSATQDAAGARGAATDFQALVDGHGKLPPGGRIGREKMGIWHFGWRRRAAAFL